MKSRLILIGCVGAAIVACSPVAVASAATRYASPSGTGPAATCPEGNPCSLEDAVEAPAVVDGDVVVVGAGLYALADELTIDDSISVGGEGPAVATILATGPGEPAISVDAVGAELADVAVFQTADDAALVVVRGTAERIAAESGGTAACTLGATGGALSLIRDGTCWSAASGPGGHAVEVSYAGAGTRSGRLRNVTAYATGPLSIGVLATSSGGGTAALDARNVIASGSGDDVTGTAGGGSVATVSLSSSNYDSAGSTGAGTVTVTPPGSGANQTEPPLLADPEFGDFDELTGSPTIDAGSTDSFVGTLDLDGEPRVQGPAADIGADERDGTTPHTTIESGPAATVRIGKVTFAFTADQSGSTFECQVDDEDFQPCSSPHTTESLDQGTHTFRVRATNPAGNVEKVPAERTFVVDKNVAGANVSARANQRIRGGQVALKVVVKTGEAAEARASGNVDVGGRRFRFESPKFSLLTGLKRTLVLRPTKKSAGKKIIKAIKHGKSAEADLAVTFVDQLGNRATTGTVVIKLKRGKH